MAVVFMVRRSDRGNDYKAFDIVQAFEASNPDGTVRAFVLPPTDPFAFVKVEGLAFVDAQIYMQPVLGADGVTILHKRGWGLRTQSIPTELRTFLLANWFVGFGGAGDQAIYGAIVAGDSVIQWSDAQAWVRAK